MEPSRSAYDSDFHAYALTADSRPCPQEVEQTAVHPIHLVVQPRTSWVSIDVASGEPSEHLPCIEGQPHKLCDTHYFASLIVLLLVLWLCKRERI